MDRESMQVWLDNYVEAWRTYEPAKIGNLFSEDALYFYSPFDDPLRGREAIVADLARRAQCTWFLGRALCAGGGRR